MCFAPKIRSLVALDPTFLPANAPNLFLSYAASRVSDEPEPTGTISTLFEACYLAIWVLDLCMCLSEMTEEQEPTKRSLKTATTNSSTL